MTRLVNFNGTVTDFGYDNADRLTSLSNKKTDLSLISSYALTLDANGNRSKIVQDEPLAPVMNPSTTTYKYNTTKNRLTTVGSTAFTFDTEGQLSKKGSTVYAFDFEHRLATIGTGTSAVQFKYDGAGNRLKAIRGSTETRYIYDASGNLLAEANSVNVIMKYYIYGAGLLQMVNASDSKNYCYHFNTIGSTIAMTDSAQAVVNKYAYTPFGAVTQTETVAQPFKYVGQFGVLQEPSGFYYMRARYYDPAVGRFISEDPIGFNGGQVNLYSYVKGNPINAIDPSGLTWQSNTNYLVQWLTGGGESNRTYSSGSAELTEIQNSPGAAALRKAFAEGGYQNIEKFRYGSGQAAWDTLLNPKTADWSSTAAQVGGFGGASVVNNGDGTATYTVPNVSGTNSFFYHVAPDRKGSSGPMRNINQTFSWSEKTGGRSGK